MFDIRKINDPHDVDKYEIVDDNDMVVFSGELDECHDWIFANS